MGWDSFAELLLDISGYVSKPHDPSGMSGDPDEEDKMQRHMTANEVEETTINTLNDLNLAHRDDEYRRSMARYRDTIRAIVRAWREAGQL